MVPMGSGQRRLRRSRCDVLAHKADEEPACFLVHEGPGRNDEALAAIQPQYHEIVVFRYIAEGVPGIFRQQIPSYALYSIAINLQT